MITKTRFDQIHVEVEAAIVELFDYAKNHNYNYILFLADGEYHSKYLNSGLSPFVISNMIDYYKEATRFAFSQHFLNIFYSFGTGVTQTTDTPMNLAVELMVYTHIWESTKFLKQLYRMTELANGRSYVWEVDNIPEAHKHSFIRGSVRDVFAKLGLKMADVMTKGFHTSLRNSFVHGEFTIDPTTMDITLHTYRIPRNLKAFELDKISANQWTEFFIYSALLNYLFILEKEKRINNILKDFGTDKFLIIHPFKKNAFRARNIYYDNSRANFSFYQSTTPYQGQKQSVRQAPPFQFPVGLTVTQQELQQLEKDMTIAVSNLFDMIEQTSKLNYAAFLYDITKYGRGTATVPFSVPEESRLKFSGHFLAQTYLQPIATPLPEIVRIQLEMLIYCHTWESKLFLKQLRSAIEIIEGTTVSWHYNFPDDRRIFTDDLIARYKAKNIALGSVIELAFHTSLRNAFAHSDYEIYKGNIILDTYKPYEGWDIPSITIEDWTNKYLYTVMLDHCMFIEKEKRKTRLPAGTLQNTLRTI